MLVTLRPATFAPAFEVCPAVSVPVTGAWLVASMVKVWDALPPPISVAVTTSVYLPSSVAPDPVVIGAVCESK